MSDYSKYLIVKEEVNEELIRKYGNRASLDGILSPSVYFTPERTKIAFVSKETYAKKGEYAWSPVQDPDNLYCIPEETNVPLSVIRDNFSSLLDDGSGNITGFGYFNISKKAKDLVDGDTSSDSTSLKRSFNNDKQIFWKLLHASVPEFIIFGGTFGYVWDDLRKEYGDYFYPIRFTKDMELNEFPEKQFSAWKMGNRPFPVLIQTYHPSCPENVFYIIPRAINEIKEGSYILEKYEVTQGD